jgi:chorismate mutase/prephenate dehydratase
MNNDQALQALRARIDALDEQLQTLISERASCAQQVAEVKRAAGEINDFYRPEREAEVLRRVAERNQGPLTNEALVQIYRELMSACRGLEGPLHVAFLGPEGTFTEAAAHKHFGHAVKAIPLAAIDEVFREVEAGTAHYGVVPVENSTEGMISHTLDMFLNSPLKICGEIELRVHQNLLGNVADPATATRVYSHQQSFAQCREWLDSHLPHAERITVSSNAEAARRAHDEGACLAIASTTAAERYNLKILNSNIEDEPDNTTRFLVIGRQQVVPSGTDKTSLLVSTRNRPGALHRLLEPLSRHGISMTRIESRPSRRSTWDYVFFVDIEGHQQDAKVMKALAALEQEAALFKVLGSYPAAVL